MAQAALRQEGNTIRFTNGTGGSLTVGNLVFFGGIVGILSYAGIGSTGPNTTLADGAVGVAIIKGVAQLTKGGVLAAKSGAPAYWDVGNSVVTPLAEGNQFIGRFHGDFAASTTYALVALNEPAIAGVAGAFQPIFIGKQAAAASGANAFFTTPFKMELVDYWIISRTTGAANFKLVQGSTDMGSVLAKGTADDTRVQGVSFIEAACIVDAGVAVTINLSAAEEVDVYTVWKAA